MKYTIYFLGFILSTCLLSCKPDKVDPNQNVSEMSEAEAIRYEEELTKQNMKEIEKMQEEKAANDNGIPNPCVLISKAQLSDIFDVEEAKINVKSGSSPNSKNTKSCFFRWDSPASPNTGLLIQLMTNPIADEYAEWPTKYVDSKITDGDNSFDGSGSVYKYKPFEGIGDAGAYNYESAKYVWRVGNEMIYTIAFNMEEKEDRQIKQVRKIADIIMSK